MYFLNHHSQLMHNTQSNDETFCGQSRMLIVLAGWLAADESGRQNKF